jgi:hypothetical protein
MADTELEDFLKEAESEATAAAGDVDGYRSNLDW